MIKIKTFLYILTIFVSFTSCRDIISNTKNWIEVQNIEKVPGKYHFLSDDGIKIYLPNVFKKYTIPKYLKLLDSISSKKDFAFESQTIKTLRDFDGNFYIYFDESSGVTYTINTMSYFPFSKRDASQLLGMIRLNNEKVSKNQNINFKKITAKYRGNKKQQIFKSIFKIDYPETGVSLLNTAYIISSNGKTVMIKLSSIYDLAFDPYIQKMIM